MVRKAFWVAVSSQNLKKDILVLFPFGQRRCFKNSRSCWVARLSKPTPHFCGSLSAKKQKMIRITRQASFPRALAVIIENKPLPFATLCLPRTTLTSVPVSKNPSVSFPRGTLGDATAATHRFCVGRVGTKCRLHHQLIVLGKLSRFHK
jgi:hypothetical protein